MSSPPKLDPKLVAQSLNFHGQQLQKLWENERGEDDLANIGVPPLNFSTYQSRQKFLPFQDRGKRLMLHQFIAKEAPALFDASQLSEIPSSTTTSENQADDNSSALMPPFEVFLNVDANARLRNFFQNVKTGELIIGSVINRNNSGIMLKVLFSLGPCPRYVADINVKAFLSLSNIIPAVDKKNVSRNYLMNDTVCCEVLEVIPDTDKISVGMKGVTRGPDDPPPKPAFGLVNTDDLPAIYKKTLDTKGESYENILEKSPGFNNPQSLTHLSDMLGLSSTHCTNLLSLRGGFPPSEYADELKQAQASKWAFKFVAEGIEHFKAGRHPEAFQCLNEALKIDQRNVEGLVARGALYANSGTFKKAIADFETSLQINPNHANARKYMGETLVALGRSYEDENKFKDAQEAYEACLEIIPFHEEAQSSLEFLKSKSNKPLIEPAELLLPNLSGSKPYEVKETLKQLLNLTEKKEKKSKKKKRGKGKKKHHRSSSSSSSSSDSSSSSSSSESSSSSSDSSDAEGGHRKKKRRSRSSAKKQRSLSPLSKRMAMIDTSIDKSHNSSFNHPFGWQPGQAEPVQAPPAPLSRQDFDYEIKVRKFLEISKEDSDYEEKVRNLLSEAEKYKRDRKMQELASQEHEKSSKARKKAKKESKKTKKESKKKRKEREREERRKAKLASRSANTSNTGTDYLRDFDQNMSDKKFRDALRKELSQKPDEKKRKRDHSLSADPNEFEKKHENDKRILEGISDLEELENKLSAYYAKVEKDTGRSSGRQDNGRPDKMYDRSRSVSMERGHDKPKWKMQMKESRSRKGDNYDDDPNKSYAFHGSTDGEQDEKNIPSPDDRNISIRRAMALKEPPPLPPPKPAEPEPPLPEEVPRSKPNIVLDKFGNFRLAKEGEGDINGPQNQHRGRDSRRSRSHSKERSLDDRDRSPRKRSSRSRSRPRKYRSRSSGSSRSSSGSRGRPRRSRSAGSRSHGSRSDRSRSGRSRSGSRSRSRSRSRSGDRFRRMRRGGWRGGRGGYDRGTYYKPRFQAYNNRGNNRGRVDFRRDDRRFDYRDRGGRRPYRPRQRGNNRGRPFRGGYRDFRDRRMRYSRSRSPDRNRRSRSYSPDDSRRHQDKEKMERFSDREGPRSEGEYEEERYVDRKEYDGKWADNGEHGGGGGPPEDKNVEVSAPKEE